MNKPIPQSNRATVMPPNSPSQGTKRAASSLSNLNSTQQPTKRRKSDPSHVRLIKKMGYTFTIPDTLAKLRTKTNQPHDIGLVIGIMLYNITPLLSIHLENPVTYQNSPPSALTFIPDFVAEVDRYTAYLRLTDGCTEKFPNDSLVNRKARRPRRKHIERYTYLVEAAFKNCIREELGDVFEGWDTEQTRLFNKGVDKAQSGVQWVVYPAENVVLEVGEGGWGVWIRGRCEELGMEEARAGRKVLEEM